MCARFLGGRQTGPSPTDRRKAGSKHHLLTNAQGVPLSFQLTAANGHDSRQLQPLLAAVPAVRGKVGRPRRRPCLDRMILIGAASLHRATSQLVLHYHAERNHQGLENKIIQPEFPVFPDEGEVACRKRLGGLLRYYCREAAGNQVV
jgi:hypothetical protein